MTRVIRKKALFLMGVFITSIFGFMGNLIQSNPSTEGSLLATTVHADLAPGVTVSDGVLIGDGGDGGDGGGSSDGGCSDGCY